MLKIRRIFFALIPLMILVSQLSFAAELNPAMKDAIGWIDANKATHEEVSRYIWENPELALVEFRSSAKLQEYLGQHGFKIEKGISGMPTAFIATWGSGKPVIGFMAEFDALPGLSQEGGVATEKPITPGAPGHGCGHNLLGSSSAAAAITVVKSMEKNGIKGTIKVFGTPAEESVIGKTYMNRDGVFDDLDVLIYWHPANGNLISYITQNALTYIKFRFYGKASHGASSEGRSALAAVEAMNAGTNLIRPQLQKDVAIRYVITKGGESPGVIPSYSEVWYSLRAPRRVQVEDLQKWVLDIPKGAALMTQTRMESQILSANYESLPSPVLSKVGYDLMKTIGPPSFSDEDHQFGVPFMRSIGKEPVRGKITYHRAILPPPDFTKVFPEIEQQSVSSDVNNVSWKVPYVKFFAGTWTLWTPLHTWQSVAQSASSPAMKAGIQASKWMAAAALECLTNPKLVQDAQEELKAIVAKNGGYKEPLPPDAKLPTFKDLFGYEPYSIPGVKK